MRILIFILMLSSCNISESNQKLSNHASILHTGFYYISDTPTANKKLLIKTNDSYYIDSIPIVTVKNFEKTTMFHEKYCYALIIMLDKKGSQLLDIAKQNYKGKKFAFVVDNQLVRTQSVDDPQFATVGTQDDVRIHGSVLAFPCNSFLPEELKNYDSIINKER